MWNDMSVAVVLPTYNEAGSIADCIRRFEATGWVDEVVVVNNNAHPDTSPAVATTGAREVFEPVQGYGAAIRRGLKETVTADLVCICEPDGTFDPEDIAKLLPYIADVDVVFGTRTVHEFILTGANMGWWLRWGNWAVAKLTELLFNTGWLSDVGCTFRVLRRSAIDRLGDDYAGNGSSFGYEMMLRVIEADLRFVQVPVNYRERVGTSSVTGSTWTAIGLGAEMAGMCLTARVRGTNALRPRD